MKGERTIISLVAVGVASERLEERVKVLSLIVINRQVVRINEVSQVLNQHIIHLLIVNLLLPSQRVLKNF